MPALAVHNLGDKYTDFFIRILYALIALHYLRMTRLSDGQTRLFS